MDNLAIESFISHCDEMMIAEEGMITGSYAYDKADWQISGYFSDPKRLSSDQIYKIVSKRFQWLLNWLNKHKMLNDMGKAMLKQKDFSDIKLTSDDLTKEGNDFMKKFYGTEIISLGYSDVSDIKKDEKILNSLYDKWKASK